MIEPYQWLVENYIRLGLKLENIGPASVDLCLGEVVHKASSLLTAPYSESPDRYFLPGYFYLCSTEEYISVPSTHCAFVNMRSSYARRGLGHKMAGFIDPGFEGQITLELTSSLVLPIPRGERIVQLIYCKLTEETIRAYKGKYLGQTGPTEAY